MALTQVTLRLPKEVVAALQHWARTEKKSVSAVVRDVCEVALKQKESSLALQTIIPEMNHVLDQRFTALSNRLMHVLTRTFLESATTRRLVLEIIPNVNDEELEQLNAEAWGSSVKSLKTTTEELHALQRNLREGLI